MRKYLEKEMLAETLRGRVQYICTVYPGMDNFNTFEIRVDQKAWQHFSYENAAFHKFHGKRNVDKSGA